MNTRLTLFKNDRILIIIDHKNKNSAKVEIDVCKERMRRGEITHIEIESISNYGATYIKELRDYIQLI